jgi:murein DD-endopeptidase MepM/ murein hydrolase activator NlpD
MSHRRALRRGLGALAVIGVFWAARIAWSAERIPVAPPIVIAEAYRDLPDTLRHNETLSHVFGRHGIAGRELIDVLAVADGIDPRRVRAGQVFTFRYLTGDDHPSRVTTRIGDEKLLSVVRDDSLWIGRSIAIDWTMDVHRASGAISSSLWATLDDLIPDSVLSRAERDRLISDVADGVFGWVVDFARDLYPGDRVELLYERESSSLGDVRFGKVLAVHMETRGIDNAAYLLEAEDGRLQYFDADGKSLRRAFLLRPVAFKRISSGFSSRRFHPVLKRYRRHAGVDYAANTGTPIKATADGTVTRAGTWGGYGIIVELRHAYSVRTRYAHMSRVARGIRPGVRVRQGQVIGYSGMTGTATGPHVHYEFLRNGVQVDPRTAVRYGTADPVPASRREEFERRRAHYVSLLFPPSARVAVVDND